MKTLFICANSASQFHLNEEYDEIMYVENESSPASINEWALKIKDAIRRLWMLQEELPEGEEKLVSIFVDAPGPYRAIVKNLQIIMRGEENIETEFSGNRGDIVENSPIPQGFND